MLSVRLTGHDNEIAGLRATQQDHDRQIRQVVTAVAVINATDNTRRDVPVRWGNFIVVGVSVISVVVSIIALITVSKPG
jgi:hypothetical protein